MLEERQIERLGSPQAIRIDVRIIAATHRDLEKRVADGTFREDLFYRLNVFPIHIPPLRERVEDIPPLVWRFVVDISKALGKRIETIPQRDDAGAAAVSVARQRPRTPQRSRTLDDSRQGAAPDDRVPTAAPARTGGRSSKLTDVEKEHIRSILESTAWRIRGAGGAAERLGLPPTTLETRIAKLGLVRPKR